MFTVYRDIRNETKIFLSNYSKPCKIESAYTHYQLHIANIVSLDG